MKLRRDITTEAPPSPEQLEVGDLVINSRTGIMYSKLVNGSIVKYVGTQLCDTITGNTNTVLPVISLSDVSSLCCNGAIVTVTVNNLIYGNRYRLLVTNLNTSSNVEIGEYEDELLPTNTSQRSVVLYINIPSTDKNGILKLSVYQIVTVNSVDTDVLKSELILSTTCQDC